MWIGFDSFGFNVVEGDGDGDGGGGESLESSWRKGATPVPVDIYLINFFDLAGRKERTGVPL